MAKPEHELALDRAKIDLMRSPDSAFFATLAFSLHHQFNETIPTARTDGSTVEYSPTFFMSLDREERMFLVLHEAMHCALLHIERAKHFDKSRYNIAADHVINLMLIERGFKMPACGIADPQYSNMSTEEVYRLLPEASKDKDGGLGDDLGEPAVSSEKLTREIEDILVRAQIQSEIAKNTPGSIPGEIQIFLNKLLRPKLPWNRILAKYLHAFNRNDYTFARPNRRFLPAHYLPSLFSQNLTDLAVAVDTSGSVSDEDFRRFISETHSILRMMQPEKISFLQFDTELKSVDEVKSVKELMSVRFSGRGGTDPTAVFEWANCNKPKFMLIFTDGEFCFPEVPCNTPIVWLIHANPNWTAPLGKTIHYET